MTVTATGPISIAGRVFEFGRRQTEVGGFIGWAVRDARTGQELGTADSLGQAVDLAHEIAGGQTPRRHLVLDDPRWRVATVVDPIIGQDGREAALLVHALDGTEVLLRWSSLEYLLALGHKIVTEAEHAMQLASEVGR